MAINGHHLRWLAAPRRRSALTPLTHAARIAVEGAVAGAVAGAVEGAVARLTAAAARPFAA